MENDSQVLAAALRNEIKGETAAQGRTMTWIADQINVPYVTLQRYLAGTRDMPLPVLIDIGNALDTPVEVLFARAERRASEAPSTVRDAEEHPDVAVHTADEGTKNEYDRAAKKGRRKADVDHAE